MNFRAVYIAFILVCCVFNLSWAQLNEQTIDSVRKSFYAYADSGNGKKALEINEQLSAYYLEIGDSSEWVRTQIHKAEILRANTDLTNANDVIKDAEEINKKLEPATVKSTFYNRKAAILFELKKHKEALVAIKESQRIDSLKSLDWRIISNLTLEAACHRELMNFKKAEKSLKKVLLLTANEVDKEEYLLALYNLAYVFQAQEKLDKAIITSNRYQKADTSKTDISKYADMLHLNAMSYRTLKKYDSAFTFLDMAHGIRLKEMESLIENNAEATKQAADLAQEKERTKRLAVENKAAGQQVIILVLAISILLIVAFIINRRRKYYKELKDKQDKLNQELKASGDFKTKLMGILAHDVRNPMNGIIGMLSLYGKKEIDEKELGKHVNTLQSNAQNVNFLIESMLSWVRSQGDSFKVNKKEFNLKEAVDAILAELSALFKVKCIEIKVENIGNDIIIYTDYDLLKLIIRNLLTNAIKYSKKQSEITIQYAANGSHLIKIIDHGIGMDAETLNKILSNQSFSKMGTKNEKGTGMGLPLVFDMTKELGGKIEIDSTPNAGTTVSLSLPFALSAILEKSSQTFLVKD